MSTIYKHLSKEDLKTERKHPALIAPEITSAPRLIGVKVAVFFSFILASVALAAGVFLYFNLNYERDERMALEASQIQFRERTQSLELESDQYRAEISRMRAEIKKISEQRDQSKQLAERNQSKITSLESQIKKLETRSKKLELEAKQAAVVPVSLAPVGGAGAISPVEAKPVAPAPVDEVKPSAPEAPVTKTAQVMTVNRKFNFVVVNLGRRDELKMGQPLVVERDGNEIGQLEVEKLYDNFAAATIIKENKKGSIREGDDIFKV